MELQAHSVSSCILEIYDFQYKKLNSGAALNFSTMYIIKLVFEDYLLKKVLNVNKLNVSNVKFTLVVLNISRLKPSSQQITKKNLSKMFSIDKCFRSCL